MSLGRHTWPCKDRVDNGFHQPANSGEKNNSQRIPPIVANEKTVKCCCGKQCKGMKGLKMHQRKCRAIIGFDESHLNEHIDEDSGSDAEKYKKLSYC